MQLLQRQKNQEKSRARLERKRVAKKPATPPTIESADQVQPPQAPKKRRTASKPKITESHDQDKINNTNNTATPTTIEKTAKTDTLIVTDICHPKSH
jgi:hypothetical protein